MRFCFITIGTAGDVHPFIGVGLALRRRGHEVVVITNPYFSERIERVGLKFHPLGTEDGYRALVTSPHLVHRSRGPLFVLRNLVIPAIDPTVQALNHLNRTFKPDVVFAHHIVLAAPHACEKLGIPCATGVLAPLFWLSRQEPVLYKHLPIEHVPRWMDSTLRKVMRPIARWAIDRPINRAKRASGLPGVRDIVYTEARGLTPRRLVLGLWSPHYRPPLSDDPETGRICGFSWFDRANVVHKPDESDLDRWLNDGKPPIIFTLGTSVVHHGQDLFEIAAQASSRLGRRALLLTGSHETAARVWPTGVHALAYAPFSRVLAAGALTVHHAGAGTMAQAMRAGKPSVIVPFANDEFDNAARAKRIGVAVTVPRHKLTVKLMCETLDSALTDVQLRARSALLGAKLVTEDGAEIAATELESLPLRRGR